MPANADEPDDETSPRNSARTRALLIELAARAFVEKGFANVSVRELAKQSEMTSGAIYGNFDSKSDLLMEVIAERISAPLSVLPDPEAVHLSDALEQIFTRYPDRVEMRALLIEGAAAGRGDSAVRRRLGVAQERILEAWTDDYRSLQQHGEVAADLEPANVVRLLWAMEIGLGILEATGTTTPDPRQAGRIVSRMVAGLADDLG